MTPLQKYVKNGFTPYVISKPAASVNKQQTHPNQNSLKNLFYMKRIMLLMLPILIAAIGFYKPVKENYFKANPITVTGWITDEQGSPVPFCSVVEKGTKSGVQADKNGYYALKVSGKKAVLEFSAVGYSVIEKKVNENTQVNVILTKASDKGLEEVVVTHAYGVKKQRKDMSYSISTQLAGKASGINIASNSPSFYNTDDEAFNTEDYDNIQENIFLKATDNPLSTFSIDVDAASYSNVRRMLKQGQLPPAGAVRIEEMINYFSYNYPQPASDAPFSFTTEMSDAPWNADHKLIMIGMQGKKIATDKLPASNLVFLIDVSGSMESPNKLELVKSSMKLLVDQMREQDKVSIVVYAGAAGLVLSPTSGDKKTTIKDALDRLQAGGSTAGGAGIQLAYKTAKENFVKGGNNRVILCTDGDFNVGASSDDDLERND